MSTALIKEVMRTALIKEGKKADAEVVRFFGFLYPDSNSRIIHMIVVIQLGCTGTTQVLQLQTTFDELRDEFGRRGDHQIDVVECEMLGIMRDFPMHANNVSPLEDFADMYARETSNIFISWLEDFDF